MTKLRVYKVEIWTIKQRLLFTVYLLSLTHFFEYLHLNILIENLFRNPMIEKIPMTIFPLIYKNCQFAFEA